MGQQTECGFTHDVLFHDTSDALVDTVVPFLATGLDAGESAVVCLTERTSRLLDAALGHDPRVAFLARDDVYSTPAGTISAYQEIIDGYVSAGAHRVRVVGEAVAHTSPEANAEWGRYEAVVNQAMQRLPVSALCTYDTRRLDEKVVELGRRTHPRLASNGIRTPNPDYVEPAEHLRRTSVVTADPVESTDPDLDLPDLTSLDDLRLRLETVLLRRTTLAEVAGDFILAVNEVATNAIRHGRPPVGVRIWVAPLRLLCTVTDQGQGFDDPFAGYIWPGTRTAAATCGMGLWLARRLCDRVDMFDGPSGFTVRLVVNHGTPARRTHRHGDGGW